MMKVKEEGKQRVTYDTAGGISIFGTVSYAKSHYQTGSKHSIQRIVFPQCDQILS